MKLQEHHTIDYMYIKEHWRHVHRCEALYTVHAASFYIKLTVREHLLTLRALPTCDFTGAEKNTSVKT
jgi:hypothetical protein